MQDFSGGGAERMMVNVAEGLAGRGHDIEIVTVRPEGPYRTFVPPGISIVTLGPRRVSRAIPALARYLRRRRPDAALSTLVHMNVAAVLAKRLSHTTTRLVLREVNPIHQDAEAEVRPLIRLSYRLLPIVYPWADHLIAISADVATDLRRITSATSDRITVLRNPVLAPRDTAAIARVDPPPHLWFNDGVPVVVSIGRLAPQKDHATLLDGIAILRQRREIRVAILGEGRLELPLKRQAAKLGIEDSVLFAGFQQNPYSWLKHAAVLAHTARWEGFGNVIVEALACGTAVVAADCPGGPREILDSGRFGRLFPVGNAAALAEALDDTLNSTPDATDLRRRADLYSVAAVLPAYEAILTNVQS